MLIAITGSSGLIGSALTRSLRGDGHSVRRLLRRRAPSSDEASWSPEEGRIDAGAFDGVDAVVNLAGENIAQRWTESAKHAIRESRVSGTSLVAHSMASAATKPRVLVSGSAVGYYGLRADETLDEASGAGEDFLASVCREWEAATGPAEDAGVRVALSRTGIVLDPHGGALAKMLTPFRLGVGGRLGDGRHWMSWIALADHVRALRFLIDHDDARGPFNLTAPHPVDNVEFTKELAAALHRPAVFPVPRLALEIAFGQMAEGAALASQRVLPRRLLDAGFEFALPRLDLALQAILRPAA